MNQNYNTNQGNYNNEGRKFNKLGVGIVFTAFLGIAILLVNKSGIKIVKEEVTKGPTKTTMEMQSIAPSATAKNTSSATATTGSTIEPTASATAAPDLSEQGINKAVEEWNELLTKNQNNPQDLTQLKKAWLVTAGLVDVQTLPPNEVGIIDNIIDGINKKNHDPKNKMVYLSDVVAITNPQMAKEVRKTEDIVRTFSEEKGKNPKANDDKMLLHLKELGEQPLFKNTSADVAYVWNMVQKSAIDNSLLVTPYSSVVIGKDEKTGKDNIIYVLQASIGEDLYLPIPNPVDKNGNNKYSDTHYTINGDPEGTPRDLDWLRRNKAVFGGIRQSAHQIHFIIAGIASPIVDFSKVECKTQEDLISEISGYVFMNADKPKSRVRGL
jgi:hypothetical protein